MGPSPMEKIPEISGTTVTRQLIAKQVKEVEI
jgi:hypothetical protein